MIVLAGSALTHATASHADDDTRYVVDRVVITVRDEPLGEGEIIHRLTTGDPMTLTGNEDGPFVEVSVDEGVTGWVDSRYITPRPIAKVELERQLEESRIAQAETEESLVRMSDDYRRLSEELQALRVSAGQPADFDARIGRLEQELNAAREEAEFLDRRNKELAETRQLKWFLAGASTLGVGLFVGFVIPRRRRAPSWTGL